MTWQKNLTFPTKKLLNCWTKKLGVKVKSHSSVISELQAKKLKEILKEPKADQVKSLRLLL